MLRKLGRATALGAGAVSIVVLLAGNASASVIWDGDASRGTGVFGINNCKSPGSVTAVQDNVHGRVWRFHKPPNSNRCEEHGIKVGGSKYEFQNNKTYYIGWSSSLSSLVDNNATFQWKSYKNHTQNFPIVLKMRGGKFTMLQRQPGGKTYYPWSRSISVSTWNKIVLGIHTSSATMGGWVELYFNGEQQTFSNGQKRWPCRTWDSYNDPKWGVYGASGLTITNLIDELKIGTEYADVS